MPVPSCFRGLGACYGIPIAGDWFIPGFLMKGALYEVAKEMVIEFKVQGGKAVSFDVRGEDGTIMATGKRKS